MGRDGEAMIEILRAMKCTEIVMVAEANVPRRGGIDRFFSTFKGAAAVIVREENEGPMITSETASCFGTMEVHRRRFTLEPM